MRDLIIGYVFIFVAIAVFVASVFFREGKLRRRLQDLQEELKDLPRR